MNYKKMMLVTFVLLAILTLGAVSASDDADSTDVLAVEDIDEVSVDASDDEIIAEESEPALEYSDAELSEDTPLASNVTVVTYVGVEVSDVYYGESAKADIRVGGPEYGNLTINLDDAVNYTVEFAPNPESPLSRAVWYFDDLNVGRHNVTVTFEGDGTYPAGTATAYFEVFEESYFDVNSDLITFREIVTLKHRMVGDNPTGVLTIMDKNGAIYFRKNVSEMEYNTHMKGYNYDQYDGYVVFKEDLNITESGVYDLLISYEDEDIYETAETTVYLDYISQVNPDELDLNEDENAVNIYLFDNDVLILYWWPAVDDDEDRQESVKVINITQDMRGTTLSFTRSDLDLYDSGEYSVRARSFSYDDFEFVYFNGNDEIPGEYEDWEYTFNMMDGRILYLVPKDDVDGHYAFYSKNSYFRDSDILTIVDNTKFRVRMESDSILDENSQFLVYCPESSVGSTITIGITFEGFSYSFNYDITEGGKYANFSLSYMNISAPGEYAFDVYDENGDSLIDTYEYEIGNPLHIPELCVWDSVGLEDSPIAVLYIDMVDNGRIKITDENETVLFDETLNESYYHSLGYDRGYYILYSDLNRVLDAGTYALTVSYFNNGYLALSKSKEIRIVERNYVEDNETGVGIELLDYYDHNLNDEEDLIALVTVPGYESGYVTVMLTDNENSTGWFVFDEIDDDDGLPTFFVSLFDKDVEEGDYLVTVIYLDANDNPLFNSSALMSFYYRGGDDDEGPMDWIDFDIIGNDDGKATFEIGDNVHVASLWIPDNEEYGSTVATITVTKNFEPFATFNTSNMHPVYHEDKDADENQIFLDLTQLNDKDIIEFNVDCFDENDRIWTYAIEIDGNNIIFHELNSMIEYYVFYGNISTGDLNNPELMGPHPNGDFMELSIPWLYDATDVRFTAKAGETTLINQAFSDSEGEFNYDILGYSYAIPLKDLNLETLLPENEIVTFTLSFGVHSSTFKRIRIGDYVAKVVTPDDVAALYEISVTDDGIFDENEIVVNIAATEDANRQSIYIDIGGGQFNIYVDDVKVEGLGEMLLNNWIYDSGVLYANPEELDEMGINQEVGINPYEFAELNDEEKAAILYDAFAGDFGSELELFRMTSYNFGCPELYLSAADLGIEHSGTYNIKIKHIPDVYEPEPGCPEDDYVYYEEVVIVDVDVPVVFGPTETVLTAEDLEMRYKDGSAWEVILTDSNGEPISGAKVAIGIVGKTYTRTTDDEGVARLPINLGRGTYEVNATFEGDEDFEASFISATITVNNPIAVLEATDFFTTPRSGENWTVTLTDGTGKVISNAKVAISIVGKTYTRTTDANGVARLPINLVRGVYEVNATYAGTSKIDPGFVSATITVGYPPATLTASDLVMQPKDGSKWNVTLKDADGNPIANAAIKFGVVGKIYTIKTDENGVAGLTINLARGVYEINATFEGNSYAGPAFVNGTVTVKYPDAVLTGNDIEMDYNDGTSYSVTLKDPNGEAIANTYVKMTIKDKTYNRKTDENGVASLPIKLAPGTHTIISRFDGNSQWSGVEITNTIIVHPAAA